MYLEAKSSLNVFYQLDRSTREIELGLEYGSPVMNIGGQSLKFEDGQWISGVASCYKKTN